MARLGFQPPMLPAADSIADLSAGSARLTGLRWLSPYRKKTADLASRRELDSERQTPIALAYVARHPTNAIGPSIQP